VSRIFLATKSLGWRNQVPINANWDSFRFARHPPRTIAKEHSMVMLSVARPVFRVTPTAWGRHNTQPGRLHGIPVNLEGDLTLTLVLLEFLASPAGCRGMFAGGIGS